MPKKLSKKAKSQRSRERALLEKVHLNAAGIDVGADTHWVAVPEDRDENPVRSFGVFTSDLKPCASGSSDARSRRSPWNRPEFTGFRFFQVLERNGFEVRLVNASHAKNVPGRKTDVKDCQWLQQLHTFGMLGGSFRPEARMCVVRSYLRLRDTLSKDCNSLVQRMQKALTEMNIQIHRVISDITGLTGMSILRAILAGERDCIKLAQMRHPLVPFAKSLTIMLLYFTTSLVGKGPPVICIRQGICRAVPGKIRPGCGFPCIIIQRTCIQFDGPADRQTAGSRLPAAGP